MFKHSLFIDLKSSAGNLFGIVYLLTKNLIFEKVFRISWFDILFAISWLFFTSKAITFELIEQICF